MWLALTEQFCGDQFALKWAPLWNRSFLFMGCSFIFFCCAPWFGNDNSDGFESFRGFLRWFTFWVGIVYIIFGFMSLIPACNCISIPLPIPLLSPCCGGGGGGGGGSSGGRLVFIIKQSSNYLHKIVKYIEKIQVEVEVEAVVEVKRKRRKAEVVEVKRNQKKEFQIQRTQILKCMDNNCIMMNINNCIKYINAFVFTLEFDYIVIQRNKEILAV